MAKAKKAAKKAAKAAAEPAREESSSQGRAVILPDGKRRVDYIREQYYEKGVERSAIRKALNEMYEKAGDKQDIPYQIVFAGTKQSREDYAAAKEEKAKEAAATED